MKANNYYLKNKKRILREIKFAIPLTRDPL